MILRRAHDALESFKQLDSHLLLSPRQLAYLCIFALGEALEIKDVAMRFGGSYATANNHIRKLKELGYIQHGRVAGYQITKEGINSIQQFFPHTYPPAL